MSYINLTNEIFKSKLGIYTQSKITFPDDVGWSNLYFIVFEGWLVMIRYLINSNPNSVDLTFQRLNNFLYI